MYNLVAVSSRSELSSVNFNTTPSVYVAEVGVERVFDWRAGDLSAKVAADTNRGTYVASTLVPPTQGAWMASKYFEYDSRAFNGAGTSAVLAIETNKGGVYRVPGGAPAPTPPSAYFGTVIDYDGPIVPVNLAAEAGEENARAKRAWKMQHAAGHAGQLLSGFHIQSIMHGSGANGPNNASVGASISSIKRGYATGTAAIGEIDSLYIYTRQGGPVPTHRNNSSDHSGILIDSTSYGNCGHGFGIEAAIRNIDPTTGALLYSAQVQFGGMETNWEAFNTDGSLNGNPLGVRFPFGFNAQLSTGTGGAGFISQGPWAMAFTVNPVYEATPFFVSPGGSVVQGPAAIRYFQRNVGGTFSLYRADNATPFFRADQSGNIYSLGNKVLGTRRTGWEPSNGDEARGSFTPADYFITASASYSSSQTQTLANGLAIALKQLNAIKSDLFAHGVIGA